VAHTQAARAGLSDRYQQQPVLVGAEAVRRVDGARRARRQPEEEGQDLREYSPIASHCSAARISCRGGYDARAPMPMPMQCSSGDSAIGALSRRPAGRGCVRACVRACGVGVATPTREGRWARADSVASIAPHGECCMYATSTDHICLYLCASDVCFGTRLAMRMAHLARAGGRAWERRGGH
jgi:hypothetical protein